jgi:hypothetical protein
MIAQVMMAHQKQTALPKQRRLNFTSGLGQ